MQQTLPSKRVVIVATLVAFILVALGLNMPKGDSMVIAAYAPTNTSIPVTSTPVSSAPSADEARERALGIWRDDVTGNNSVNAINFTYKSPNADPGALEIRIPPSNVQIAYFSGSMVKSLPQTATTVIGTDTWVTTLTVSPLGSKFLHVTITKNGTLVADYDVKVVF